MRSTLTENAMFDFLTSTEITIAAAVVGLGLGMSPIGTKITDWFKGIPADLRAALNGVEKTVVANVKVAQQTVVAALPQPAAKPPVPTVAAILAATPAVPAAPVAPAA